MHKIFLIINFIFLLNTSVFAIMESQLQPLNRACLPVAGRMLKDTLASCHCPPESLCPLTLSDFNQAKKLPPDIANICCNRPKECTFEKTTQLACGNLSGLSSTPQAFCNKLIVKSSNMSGDGYKNALTKIATVNNLLTPLVNDIIRLATITNASTAQWDYNAAANDITQVMNILKNVTYKMDGVLKPAQQGGLVISGFTVPKNSDILDAERALDNSLWVDCETNNVTFCNRTVSDKCPVPDNCASPSDLTVTDRQGWFTSPPPACWCPTGNVLDMSSIAPDYYTRVGQRYYLCAIAGDCVGENTKVTMADGTLRDIKDVKVGEFVKGYMSINKVMAVNLNDDKESLYSINNDLIKITSGHPIFTSKGWKAIDKGMVVGENDFKKDVSMLEVGDEMLMADESIVIVKSIERNPIQHINKYNLSVGGDSTFVANGIVIRAYKARTPY